MEINSDDKGSNSDYNKEGKYREEIFKLLESTVKYEDETEKNLVSKLFKEDSLDKDELIELIKKLK